MVILIHSLRLPTAQEDSGTQLPIPAMVDIKQEHLLLAVPVAPRNTAGEDFLQRVTAYHDAEVVPLYGSTENPLA
jgi:hypothetical protein